MSRRTVLLAISTLMVLTACGVGSTKEMRCDGGEDALILAAQAVPGATMLPCITTLPVGWSLSGFSARTGSVRFWMDSDSIGAHAVEVELSDDCDTSGAVEVEPGPDSVRWFEESVSHEPGVSGRRFSLFPGGCVTLRYGSTDDVGAAALLEAESSLTLVPRSALVTALEERRGLILCGAGAPACAGGSD